MRKKQIEFGDFQTPHVLAVQVCERLFEMGIRPDTIIEPTCGLGAFVEGAAKVFGEADIFGYEINEDYLKDLDARIEGTETQARIRIQKADFFNTDWRQVAEDKKGSLLILGNLPWVTSAVLGALGSENIPVKSNFLSHKGLDAITGKANFDISEWMLLELIQRLNGRRYDVAMLLKTATARKIISFVERTKIGVSLACIMNIDAKRHFNATVDASLLVMRVTGEQASSSLEHEIFPSLTADAPIRVGHRHGLMVGNLKEFDAHSYLFGNSPQKWRSGIKHDASSVMEFTMTKGGLINGLDETVALESTYLYPLMKGSDIGSNREWRGKYVLVTQKKTGQDTSHIRSEAPETWKYLERHSEVLNARASSIYAQGSRFSIFGIGDYAFRPWRIAICGLYKKLNFRLVGPIEGRAVMFDDTVYYVSFDTEAQAREALAAITGDEVSALYRSMIFWDEKRPIKSSILNHVDWQRVRKAGDQEAQASDEGQAEARRWPRSAAAGN